MLAATRLTLKAFQKNLKCWAGEFQDLSMKF
jgi:hypothetical protein